MDSVGLYPRNNFGNVEVHARKDYAHKGLHYIRKKSLELIPGIKKYENTGTVPFLFVALQIHCLSIIAPARLASSRLFPYLTQRVPIYNGIRQVNNAPRVYSFSDAINSTALVTGDFFKNHNSTRQPTVAFVVVGLSSSIHLFQANQQMDSEKAYPTTGKLVERMILSEVADLFPKGLKLG